MSRSLYIAYLGPPPREGRGGVPGVAALVLDGLLNDGHRVDCYLAGIEAPLPDTLTSHANFELVDGNSRFRYGAWYSRNDLTKFVSGQAMRALAERRLAQLLNRHHRGRPYDLVYQFSHLEVFKLGGSGAPPLIVHPETHTAGELRWLKRERALARACEPPYRRLAARAILSGRTALQSRHVRLAAGFVCPSRAFQRCFCDDYGIDPRRTRVVPNPIDLRLFQPEATPRLTGPVRVLYASRISVRKGVETIVELSRRIADLAGSVVIEVVGGPTQWSDYRGLLSRLDPRVARYEGSVSATDMPTTMAKADILVQPSKYEPFGLTVGEALASGTPVVVTDEVGAAEDVSDECARRAGVGDVAGLERALRRLVEEIRQGHGPRLSLACRAEAERLFDPARVSHALADAFEELAA